MWCGPYALAVCLGLSYDEAYELALKVTRQDRIKGLANHYVEKALRRHGIRTEFKGLRQSAGVSMQFMYGKQRGYVSVLNLRNALDYLKPNRLYIINVTRHYVVLDTSDMTVIDNQTRGWWPVDRHRNAGKQVQCVAEVCRVNPAA